MSQELETSQYPSSQVQIDDVLQGYFDMNTQGCMYTTNPGGSVLTSHEISAILDFLEVNYHKMFGHNQGTEYGKERKRTWNKLCELVSKVHGYKREFEQIKMKINNMIYQGERLTIAFCVAVVIIVPSSWSRWQVPSSCFLLLSFAPSSLPEW